MRSTFRQPARLLRLAAGMLLAGAGALAHARDPVSLQAEVSFVDDADRSITLQSNVVTAQVDDNPATIAFYTDATYSHTASAAGWAKTLYLGINARGCNRDPGVVETMVVDIWSRSLQRNLQVPATETGPDTGLFQFKLVTGSDGVGFQAQVKSNTAATPLVPASHNDIVTAQIESCGSGTIAANILIDPSGVVFD